MTRTRVLAALAVLALAAGALWWRGRAAGKESAFRYETAALDRGRVIGRVTATGTLSALVTVQVGSQVSGRIASLNADFNSRVKKGEVIARIDPQLFQAAVDQAKANVVAAEGNLAKAAAQAADSERQLKRTRQLADRQLVAAADLDTAQSVAEAAQASVKAAQGGLAQAQAALSQSNVNLAYTRIVSPTDGVVISRNVDVGQTVAASLQAPTLFVIAEDLAKMQVDTSVAESDVGRLRGGMDASFTVDAYPGRVFQGKVRQVRNSPQTVQNVVTYDAVIDVQNPELLLKPGMTATATFVWAEKDDVLRVPNAALRFRPPAGMPGAEARAAAPVAGASGATGANPAAGGSEAGGAPAGGNRKGSARGGGQGGPAGAGAEGSARARGGSDAGRLVYALRAGQPVPVRVKTGISDGTFTELVQGELSEGEALITDATGPAGKTSTQGGGGGGPPRGPRLF